MKKLFILSIFYSILAHSDSLDDLLKPNDNIFTPDNTTAAPTPALNIKPKNNEPATIKPAVVNNPEISKGPVSLPTPSLPAPSIPVPAVPAIPTPVAPVSVPKLDPIPVAKENKLPNITLPEAQNNAPGKQDLLPQNDNTIPQTKEDLTKVTKDADTEDNKSETNPPLIDSKLGESENSDAPINPTTQTDSKYILSSWSGSLMFNEDLLRILNDTLDKFQRSMALATKKGKDGSVDILDIAGRPATAPSFYLNSIIYKNDNDWVVWLNNIKITHKNYKNLHHIFPGLKLLFVNESEIGFNYNTSFLNDMSPNWERKLIKLDNDSYNSATQDIIVSKNSGNIVFNLQPNQTFVLYNMSIEEGYIGDVSINQDPSKTQN